jgi:hypothetical protein
VRWTPASEDVNTEAEESTALEAVTRLQPVNVQQTEELMHSVVNYRVGELAIALQLFVATFCKCLINPITHPNSVYSHSYT